MKHSREASRPIWLYPAAAAHVGLICAYVALWIGMARGDQFWRADFSAFYMGWRMVLEGQGDHLYDRTVQKVYQARFVPEREAGDDLLAFVNPPQAALALAPLGYLSRSAAFYVWAILQLGFLLLTLRFSLDWTIAWSTGERLLLILTFLAFPPILMTFQLGQVSLASVLCLTGFYSALRKERQTAAAMWLVLGTFKPQLMVVPAVTLLVGRHWRALVWCVLFFGVWAGLTTVFLGWSCWLGFLELIRYNSQQFDAAGIFPERMYNLKGLLTAALGGERAEFINSFTWMGLLVAILGTVWIWRKGESIDSADFERKSALSLQLGLIANPHLNPADALCYVLPALLFLVYLRKTGRPWLGGAIFLLTWPWLFAIDTYALVDWPGRFRPFFLLMLGVLVWMAMVPNLQKKSPDS